MKVSKELGMIDSNLLCEYILRKKEPMSHLKLQKVLYYVEALHLANFGQSLVEDKFEAWVHGPVSRKIFDKFKDASILHKELMASRSGDLKAKMEKALTGDQIALIDEVISVYGKYTAIQLESLSHSEMPWIEARRGYGEADRCAIEISKDSMRNYYKQMIYGEGREN